MLAARLDDDDDFTISRIPNANNSKTFLWFQVLLSNTNNYMVSSNDFFILIVINSPKVTRIQANNSP